MQTITSLSVQFGCGHHAPRSWLNFDSSPTLRFERIPLIGSIYTKNANRFPAHVRYGNIVRGLPIAKGTVERLYASHVLKHLAYEDAMRALRNCLLLLVPGGRFRLIVPDLAARARAYVASTKSGDPAAAAQFMDATLLGERQRPHGVFGMLSSIWGGAAHRWMWNEASMQAALVEVGFDRVRRCSFGDSNEREFSEVENEARFKDGEFLELAMECRRPPAL
jgi:predicted SAM-dependent methyltransferase